MNRFLYFLAILAIAGCADNKTKNSEYDRQDEYVLAIEDFNKRAKDCPTAMIVETRATKLRNRNRYSAADLRKAYCQ